MLNLSDALKVSNQTRYVGLSGVLAGKFYHTVFLPIKASYQPYVLFEDGADIAVSKSEGKKSDIDPYSYFDLDGKRHIFNTRDCLWFDGALVNSVSASGVTDFKEGKISDASELYARIRTTLQDFYDFPTEEEVDIVVCHIIHSYILGLLGKTFYLLLDGEANTGKSTLQRVMAQLQHNGCFSGKSTMPSMVRKVHYLRASINIDEFEKLKPDEKSLITGVLNTGAYHGGTVEITNMDAKSSAGQIKIFNTFGTKTFSVNKAPFDSTLLSRCITINTIRNTRKIMNIYDVTENQAEVFQGIRNATFAFCLKNGKQILQSIKDKQEIMENRGYFGRRCDIFSIICGIKRFFTGNDDLLHEFLHSKEEMDVEDEKANDRLYYCLKFLSSRMKEEDGNVKFSNEELRDYIGLELELEEGNQFFPTAQSVGKLLKRSKIVMSKEDRHRVGGRGNYEYSIPSKRILEIIGRSGFDDLKFLIPKTKFTSSRNAENKSPANHVNNNVNSENDSSLETMPF